MYHFHKQLLQRLLASELAPWTYAVAKRLAEFEESMEAPAMRKSERAKSYQLRNRLLVELEQDCQHLLQLLQTAAEDCQCQTPPQSLFVRVPGPAVGFKWNPQLDSQLARYPKLVASLRAKTKLLISKLAPWRKGPYYFDLRLEAQAEPTTYTSSQECFFVDAEWRSDLKWQRLQFLGALGQADLDAIKTLGQTGSRQGQQAATFYQQVANSPLLSLHGKRVLDVGPGNGYHLHCMLNAGAALAVGLEPYEAFVQQSQLVDIYLQFSQQQPTTNLGNQLPHAQGLYGIEPVALEPGLHYSNNHTLVYVKNAETQDTAASALAVSPELAAETKQSQPQSSTQTKPTQEKMRPFLLPAALGQVQAREQFDVVFNMGVLYHVRDPQDFIQQLAQYLVKGGQLVLETICLPGSQNLEGNPAHTYFYHQEQLPSNLASQGFSTPTKVSEASQAQVCQFVAPSLANQQLLQVNGKYAGMPNVSCIPSKELLLRWVELAGFKAEIVHAAYTSADEQRSTEFSSPESLVDFIAKDAEGNLTDLTIEGYPRPYRVIILATKI